MDYYSIVVYAAQTIGKPSASYKAIKAIVERFAKATGAAIDYDALKTSWREFSLAAAPRIAYS